MERRYGKADLVIVGGGLSGLSAAIEAKEQGISDVLVLEKNHAPGGNGIFPDLMVRWDGKVPDLPALDDDGIAPDDPRLSPDPQVRADAIFKAMMEWNHWRGDGRLIRTLIDETQQIYPWIEGMLTPEDRIEHLELHKSHMHGLQIRVMLRRCRQLGVKILTGTAGKHVIRREDGEIAGVLAQDADGELEIRAPHVILSAGGFLGDRELMAGYLQNYDASTAEDFVYLGLTYSGDGVRMAFEAGAADDGTVAFECDPTKTPWMGPRFTPCRDFFSNVEHPQFIWVSRDGERFADESRLNATNSMYRLPGKRCWILFDEKLKEYIVHHQQWRPWLYPRGMTFEKEFEAQIEKGYTKRALSWEELGDWIGCQPGALTACVEEYNQDCILGRDRWFCKPKEALFPLERPPFYASLCRMPMIASRGPLRVNCKMELLRREDYRPIYGLYAAGVDIGGMDSDCYAGCSPSHSSQFAVASGRIAGRTAAAYLKSEG